MISLTCGKRFDFEPLRFAPAAFKESKDDKYSGWALTASLTCLTNNEYSSSFI